GFVELAAASTYSVRLLDGELVQAELAPGVEASLIQDVLQRRAMVLVSPTQDSLLILGALQTRMTPGVNAEGDLEVRARRVNVQADEEVRLRSGQSELQLEQRGRMRLNGERLYMRVHANVRVYSAKVELP
ncbi:MAG: hypothetical protein KC492_18330, partial [Myxococcales bacterium]|nr:hypothetical protein [Myxococcales bacterium]